MVDGGEKRVVWWQCSHIKDNEAEDEKGDFWTMARAISKERAKYVY